MKSTKEKEYFLTNFKDSNLILLINNITELFHAYPFFHAALLEQAEDEKELDLLTQWQKHYYLDIYNEYISAPSNNVSKELTEIYQILEKNTSFQFLIKLLSELSDQTEGIDKWESLEKAYSYYQLKNNSPYKKETLEDINQKFDSYTEVINSGGTLYDKVSSDEKIYISRSIDMFLSRISNPKM